MLKKGKILEGALLSIIIPVFNIEKYLERCIESVINQTYQNIEIIIVDDGSTDSSAKICDHYKTMDNRISVFHEKHGGTSRARNAGLNHAKGEFIGFVDSDDYIAPDMYEKLLQNMSQETDITCCARRCVVPGKKSYNAYQIASACRFSNQEAVEELLLLRGLSFSVCTKLFRKELFHDIIFPVGKNCEDLPVTYHLIKKSRNVFHIAEAKYFNFYRKNSRSSHSDDTRWMDYVIFSRDILLDVMQNYPQLKKQAEARYLMNALNTMKGIKNYEKKYGDVKYRLEEMLKRMFLRGMLNPYIAKSFKKVLLEYSLLGNTDWTQI